MRKRQIEKDKFLDCLAVYGTDLEKWPDDLRSEMEMIIESNPELLEILHKEKELEELLNSKRTKDENKDFGEDVVKRTKNKTTKSDVYDNPGVIAPPPLIFICFLALGYLLNKLYPILVLERPLSTIISGLFFVYAGLTAGLAFYYMVKSGTNVDVRKPTLHIVTTSVYSYTRNPMYLSMVILLIAFTFLFNDLWFLLLIPFFIIVMQKGVIEREELYLENKFGNEYIEYKERVRRWI